MYSIFRRSLSFLLALILCVSSLPMAAWADSGETEADDAVPVETSAVPEESTAASTTEASAPEETQSVSVAATAAEEAAVLTRLSVKTLPRKTVYLVGESVELTGLVLVAEYDSGEVMEITPEDGITLAGADTSAPGTQTVTVTYGELTASFSIGVHAYEVVETSMSTTGLYYSCPGYHTWSEKTLTKTCPDADYLKLTFSGSTYADRGITIWDGDGNEIGSYYYANLANKTITVPGDTVKIQIKAFNDTSTYSMVSVSSLIAALKTPIHEPVDAGVYTAPGCFTDGYTTLTCRICHQSYTVQDTGSAGHSYSGGFCIRCGMPEAPVYSGTLSDTVTWAITADSALYICGSGEIPSYAYQKISQISSVTRLVIGDGMTKIGYDAFQGSTALATVTIPGSVTKIDSGAFRRCTALTAVSIPNSVTEIGSSAFEGCTALTAVTIPGNVSRIGSRAFYGCNGLEALTLEDGIAQLGSNAFGNCYKLKHLFIPASVTTISADRALDAPFLGCSSLALYCAAEALPADWGSYFNCSNAYNTNSRLSVNFGCTRQTYEYWRTADKTAADFVIPQGITLIPDQAFLNQDTLVSITIPGSVKHIGSNAFEGCDNLQTVQVSPGLEAVGNFAFCNCDKLVTISLPEGTASIGNNAFDSCDGLETVSLAPGLKTIGNYAFNSCDKLTNITLPEGTESIGDLAFAYCFALTGLEIPEGVTHIGSRFLYATRFTDLTLPATLVSCGAAVRDGGMLGGSGITSVTFAPGTTRIPDYALYNYAGYSNTSHFVTAVNIPDSVTDIGSYAFYRCSSLADLDLPDSILSIGDFAFGGCSAITDIQLPEGLTTIGQYLFMDCTSLKELTLPSTLTGVGHDGCWGPLTGSSITSVTFAPGTTHVPAYILSFDTMDASEDYASTITSVTFADPTRVTSIGEYAFCCCISLTDIAIPASVTEIGNHAFAGCSGLTALTLPQGLTTIGSSAFSRCSSLTGLQLPDSLTNIESNAFYQCKALTSVQIPESVTVIRPSTFYQCTSLTDVQIPASVTVIEANAFNGCSALKEITIHPGQRVEGSAFSGCTAATSLTIGDGAYICSLAFYNCKSLVNIRIGKNVTFEENALKGVTLQGSCGLAMTWLLDPNTGVLTLTGYGPMENYSEETPAPWGAFASLITSIEFQNSITGIGSRAFAGAENLRSVILPDTLKTIGSGAFALCTGLQYVEIPASVTKIGDSAFLGCSQLEEVVLLGAAPGMGENCFRGTGAQVFYPLSGSGYTARFRSRQPHCTWVQWDDSVPTRDIVILLDISSGMSGNADALTQAAARLTREIGGARRKTRISIVAFSSSQDIRCRLTTDPVVLGDALSGISTYGSTQYRSALMTAAQLLQDSPADEAYAILLGGTAPTDSESTWLPEAEALLQTATVYALGFAPTDSARQAMVKAAGSEGRYYDIARLDDLIATFGKSEFATAQMVYMGQRYDLLDEGAEVCVATLEPVSFYIRPGIHALYDSVAQIALRQDGQLLLTSATGIFENVMLKDHFQPVKPVEAVFLDPEGKEISSVELRLTFRESYTITYILIPGKTNTVYHHETYVPGTRLVKPEDPSRQGYVFKGWYTSENCTGLSFFNILNSENHKKLEGDITLYARWENDQDVFLMGRDSWSFENIESAFFPTGVAPSLEMTWQDQVVLFDGDTVIDADDESWIQYIYYIYLHPPVPDWGGSCFGMSSVAVLSKAGILNINDFDSRCHNIFDATLYPNVRPEDVGNVESLISYYQTLQHFKKLDKVVSDFDSNDESKNLNQIIKKMKKDGRPVVLNLEYIGEGGHAVVAYDLKETETGYTFEVYDCNVRFTSFTVTVTVLDGIYTADCTDWETEVGCSIMLHNVCTVDDLMKETILVRPGTPLSTTFSNSPEESEYLLHTNYGGFTVSNGSQSAVISGGKVISGDLSIRCRGLVNNAGSPLEYAFYLPALSGDGTYTITQTGSGNMDTAIYYGDVADGFFIAHDAGRAGEITFTAAGTVSTHYDTETAHSLQVTINSMTTPWSCVDVSGTSTGFALTPSAEKVDVTSETETTVSIETSTVFNGTTLENVPVGAAPVEVEEGQNEACVVTRDDEIIASSTYGYSVIFNSRLGSNVEALTNVPAGSLIQQPADPTREGFLFGGWFRDADCTEGWDFAADTVNADLVLYARWDVDPDYVKSVTFRVPGMADQIVYLGAGSLINEDYAPTGTQGEPLIWYETPDFRDDPWDFGADILTEDTILYGKTTLHTLSFVTNCAQTLPDQSLYSGSTAAEPSGLTLAGYTLCGWYTEPEFRSQWDFETDTVSEDMTLYARWLANETDKNGQDTGICIEVLGEDSIVYTGKAITPTVIVRDNGRILTPGTDYTVSYRNNTAARDKDDTTVKAARLPQIIIQGKGNYKSTQKIIRYFTIGQANMQDLQVTLPGYVAVKAGNKLQTVKATVKTGSVTVPAGSYTILYYTDEALTTQVKGISQPGTYYLVLEAKQSGNYRGRTGTFVLEAVTADRLLSSAKLTAPKSITALSQPPEETAAISMLLSKITVGKAVFSTEGENLAALLAHFTLSGVDSDGTAYSQNQLGQLLLTSGRKTILVSAKPDNPAGYVGEKALTVTVKGTALNKSQFTVTFDRTGEATVTSRVYSGSSQTPSVFTELVQNVDYTLRYKQGKTVLSAAQVHQAGTYTLEIAGKGAYSGTLTYKFTITRVNLASAYAAGRLSISSPGSAVYSPSGAALKPTLLYTNDRGGILVLTEGKDYTLKYAGNKAVTANASATITGTGSFTGSVTKAKAPELTFRVTPKALSSPDITVSVTGITMKNGAITAVKYTVYDRGKKVAAKVFTGTITDREDTVLLTITAKEGGSYTGSRAVEVRKNLVKATDKKQVLAALVSDQPRYYTGAPIAPAVSITDPSGADISHCFTVTYGGNTNVGVGTIVITGRPEMGYYGEKTLRFPILPKWAKWIFG